LVTQLGLIFAWQLSLLLYSPGSRPARGPQVFLTLPVYRREAYDSGPEQAGTQRIRGLEAPLIAREGKWCWHNESAWCAANFSYLMAIDARRNLLQVPGVDDVTVRLGDHFAAKAIEDGVNSAKPFSDSFPDEAWDNLEQLRDLFLRKGYIGRQEKFLRQLINAGLSYEEISGLRSGDVVVDGESFWIHRDGAEAVQVGPASVAWRYFQRREELGLDCSPTGALIRNLRDQSVPAEILETYFAHSRTARVSAEATGTLCSVLLQARQAASGIA